MEPIPNIYKYYHKFRPPTQEGYRPCSFNGHNWDQCLPREITASLSQKTPENYEFYLELMQDLSISFVSFIWN